MGAYRAGEQVPLSEELDRELRKYEGYSSPFEELPVDGNTAAIPSIGPPTPTEETTPHDDPPAYEDAVAAPTVSVGPPVGVSRFRKVPDAR